jgi:NitT/TauT family transport system substrate-binding protein
MGSFRRAAVRFACLGFMTFGLALSGAAQAQSKPPVKVRYAEVVRSIFFGPAYVALSKGYFKDGGLDVALSTAQGGDKAAAALLSNIADIALMGPESAIYVWNSESPMKLKMFAAITVTDGFVLVSRDKIGKFEWKMLKGKEVLGFRPGSTPLLFLEAAMKKNGIDPLKDVKLSNNVAIPARMGSWLAGQNQYGVFLEPEASQLERDGKAFFAASPGQEVGAADYTAFMATEKYIKDNPQVVQAWTNGIYRAQQFIQTAPASELVKALAPFFPGVDVQTLAAAVERYKTLKIWKTTPLTEPQAFNRFQDILVQGGVLEPAKRVKYENLVLPEFAKKAK